MNKHKKNHNKHHSHPSVTHVAKEEAEFEEILSPPASKEIFSIVQIGEFLKERRQNLKLEITDVSSYLKVKAHDIEAIENDNLAGVTKHLYVPGLIRSYARFLKLDPKVIEENIRVLPIESNVKNKKHQLLNIG